MVRVWTVPPFLRRAWPGLLCTLLLSTTNFLNTPLLQEVVLDRVCTDYYASLPAGNGTVNSLLTGDVSAAPERNCSVPVVSAEAEVWNQWMLVGVSAPGIVMCALFGALSDHYGRRLPFIVSTLAVTVQTLIQAFGVRLELPLMVFVGAQIACGLAGSFSTFLMASFAYVADVSDASERSRAVSTCEAMLFIGGCIGPAIGGWLTTEYSFETAYWANVGLGGTALLWSIFGLRESLPKSGRTPELTLSQMNFVSTWGILLHPSITLSRWYVCDGVCVCDGV
jgi:MFS family permease